MIIPVRCFTCNNMLASKYLLYTDLKKKQTPAQDIFNILGVTRICCKRHLISHIDLVDKI